MCESYRFIVGTGGIGTGMLFHSLAMETLGRSESRPVILSNAKDYCKQHIVLHYAAILGKENSVIPIGFIGQDTNGNQLLREMRKVGMNTGYVGISRHLPTMLSICLQYPDKEGCNFTAVNNAMQEVTTEYIEACIKKIGIDKKTIVAAIPEAPIESRLRLLELGKKSGAYCVLSVPVSEVREFGESEAYECCDLLAVNEEEAMAIVKTNRKGKGAVEDLYQYLTKRNPTISLIVTCGASGSYTIQDGKWEFVPALESDVINTTGAGDACLGGTLAGMAAGLALQKGTSDKQFGDTPIKSAMELGVICAGMAVACEDSIAWNVKSETIREYIHQRQWTTEQWYNGVEK